jgi:hypothetical protein
VVFFVVLIPVYSLLDTYFGFKIPIWIETPSIIGLYGLFIKLHDKYLWKVKRLGFAIPVLPDLNGKWKSEINSSYEGGTVKEADVNIFQTYSKFSMTLKTDESSSETIMAHFSLCDPIQQKLTYCFRSDPKGVAPATMNPHNGVASLDIRDDGRQLKGFYFTGRGRMTQGDITLTKVVVTQDRNPITPPVMRTKE